MAQSKSVTAYLRAKDAGFTSVFGKASGLFSKFKSGATGATASSKSFTTGIKSVVTSLGLFKVAQMAVTSVTSRFSAALGRMDTMDAFTRTMGIMGHSTEMTKQTLDALKGSTKGTAYGLDVAAKAAQNFITRGIAPDKAAQSVSIWMDAVSTFGKGTNEELASVTDALGKMRTKGTVEMDQLNRLFDVGIDAVGMYAKAVGRSSSDVQEDLSDGKITTAEFLDVVETAMREGTNGVTNLAGAAKNAGAAWRGSIDNMKAATTRGVVTMIEKFDQLTKKLTGTDLKGWIANVGKFFEENLGKIADAAEKVVDKAIPYINILKLGFEEVRQPVIDAIDAVKASLGELYANFDQTTPLVTFRDVVQAASEKIQDFSKWIQDNSDKIALIISKAPQAVAALMAFRTIQSVTGVIADFGFKVSDTLNNVFKVAHGIDARWTSVVVAPLMGAITSGTSNVKNLLGVFNLAVQESFNKGMTGLNTNKYTAMFKALGDGISYTFPKFSKLSNAVLHPVSSLKSLAGSLVMAGAQAGGSATVMGGVASKISGAFKLMKSGGIAAIKSLTAAMLSNPITALLIALAAAIAFVAAAWKSNFMNIQGVVKSFGSSIKNSLTSLKSMFSGMEGVVEPFMGALKAVGAILTGYLGIAIAVMVDQLRAIVFAVSTVVKGFIILGHSAKMVAKACSGDWKGAGEEFDKIKDQVGQIGDNFDNLKKNSALKAIPDAMKEWGKESSKAKAVVTSDLDAIDKRVRSLSDSFNETAGNLTSAFDVEGATDTIKKHYEMANDTVKNYQTEREQIIYKSNQMIKDSEGKSEEERRQAIIKASELVMSDTGKYNGAMLALYQEYSESLRTNKDAESKDLTESQRSALQEQTDLIRSSLAEQNQLYVEMSVQKLANGEKLSQQERTAAIANMTALYTNKTEQIQSNEAKITELRAKLNETQNEAEKQNYLAQIETLRANNESVRQEYAAQGENILALLLNGNENNASAVLNGMSAMNNITNEQLAAMFQAFVNSGQSVDQQLVLMAGILEQRGAEGANNLVTSLISGDYAGAAAQMNESIKAGIQSLPPEMFSMGDSGKQMFINALEAGNYEQAGRFLTESTASGVDAGKSTVGDKGGDVSDTFVDSIEAKTGEAKSAGEKISKAAAEGAEQQAPQHKTAGEKTATEFVKGVESKEGDAKSAGTNYLANQVKAGASSVSLNAVGANMALGVAAGINANAGSAVAAMASLVARVNAEAKKKAEIKSPSRLLKREVGFMLPAGVADGIKEKTKLAVSEAANMVSAVQNKVAGSSAKMNIITGQNGTITLKNEAQRSYFDRFLLKVDELINTVKDYSGPTEVNPVLAINGRIFSEEIEHDLTEVQTYRKDLKNRLWGE